MHTDVHQKAQKDAYKCTPLMHTNVHQNAHKMFTNVHQMQTNVHHRCTQMYIEKHGNVQKT